MEFEDRVTLATPEGVDVQVTLAGLGSRFVASLVDTLLKFAVILAVIFAGEVLTRGAQDGSSPSNAAATVVALLLLFLISIGYDILFETLASGRTPGKRWAGLRVVRDGGRPIGFLSSTIRNLLRLVDGLPVGYLVGVASILISSKNKRVGDIAAGTIVVRERKDVPVPVTRIQLPRGSLETASSWDVSAVTSTEIATVRKFLERRNSLASDVRGRLAWELAERLRPKVGGAPQDQHPEIFLAQLVATKSARN